MVGLRSNKTFFAINDFSFKGKLPHPVYACVFLHCIFESTYVGPYMSMKSNLSTSNIQCYAKNECVNRMCIYAFNNRTLHANDKKGKDSVYL